MNRHADGISVYYFGIGFSFVCIRSLRLEKSKKKNLEHQNILRPIVQYPVELSRYFAR